MMTRRQNPVLSTTRRWTAGVLLASTLAVGGLGLHLADSYAATSSSTVVASGSTDPATTGTTGASGTTGATGTSATSSSPAGSSGFGAVGSVGSSAGSGTTTTKGS